EQAGDPRPDREADVVDRHHVAEPARYGVEDDRLVARRELRGRDGRGGTSSGAAGRRRRRRRHGLGHVVIRWKRRIVTRTATSVTRIALSRNVQIGRSKKNSVSGSPVPKNSALVPSRIVPGLSRTRMIPRAPDPWAMTALAMTPGRTKRAMIPAVA